MFSLKIEETIEDGIFWNGPHVSMRFSSNILLQSINKDGHYEYFNLKGWEFKTRKTYNIDGCIDGCDTLIADTFKYDDVELTREICFNKGKQSFFRVRLLVKNFGSNIVRLLRLTPILVEGAENLIIGESEARKWSLFRSARHKNDIPSVCILGKFDEAYIDALKGPVETKDEAINSESSLISDELTVLRGNEGAGPGTLLIGFLTGTSQLVNCKISTDNLREQFRRLEASCLMDGVLLEPGEEKAGEWLWIDGNEDVFSAIENFSRIKGRMSNSFPLPNPPSVYCTWYYYGETINQEDVIENLEALKQCKIPIDVFQIDAGWYRAMGDWEANGKFPLGMKYVADLIKSYGFRPGIWTAPFIIEPECEIRYSNPDWLLKRDDGSLVTFEMNNNMYYVLDVTHPEVLRWIEELYRKITHKWGYTYHKIDFARAVALDPKVVFYDRRATRAEAFRKGVEAIRKGAGPEAYILMCGGLYSPSSGLVNAHRTSSDVITNTRGPSFYTIKQNVLRYWMGYLWHNDPDALIVRRKTDKFRGLNLSLGLLSDDEVRIFALNQYFAGGLVCFSERIREVDQERLGLLRHVIPSLGRPAIPRDMFLGKKYPSIYDVEVRPVASGLGEWHTVAFINWSDKPLKLAFNLDENIVGKFSRSYEQFFVSEFWSGKIWSCIKYGDRVEVGELRPLSAALVKITPQIEDEPALLYSNGHFSMGGTEITSWEYKGDKLIMGIDWKWDYPIEFIIQSPDNTEWHENGGICEKYSSNKNRIKICLQGRYKGNIELKLRPIQ